MKSIFKITVALLGAIAVLSPTNAQDTKAEEKTPPSTVSLLKSMLLGTGAESAFKANTETKYLFNVTDANYKDILFNEECIINFCSSSNLHCAEYYEHYLEAAETLGDDSPAKFVTVWVDETPLISARFFVPARLPYVLYAKEGEFHWIPYRLNDTKFLVEFVEEEKYQLYPILNGITAPNGRLARWFENYATASEWVGQYTSWMPRWMILMIAGSMSGMIFQFFSGGSAYASDPARYPHLNQDGTSKKTEEPKEKKKKKSDESSKDGKVKKSKKSSSSSEQTTKTKKKTKKTKSE
ncbi:hypothetical protein BGW42_008751 [Actinomortierella wolfii]|nr:hypothetical protein BGW42_008751 [Actinomortierella wolfii]